MPLPKYDVLSTEIDEAGELRVKVGIAGEDEGGVLGGLAFWGIDGFISRPADPKDDEYAQALVWQDGSDARIVGLKDNRLNARYGELSHGDKAIVTVGPARLLVKNEAASITALTENDDGELLVFQLSGKKNNLTIMLPGSDGTTMIQAKSGEIKMAVNGGGSIVIDKDGVKLYGNVTQVNSGTVYLGLIAPNVSPQPVVNSVLMGPTGIAGVPSSKVFVAT